jgi:alpha-beta hydrolase superfamily lysophospholipase
MEIPGFDGYSMAEHFAVRGWIVIACDHLATGGSSRPRPASRLTSSAMVAANDLTVRAILGELTAGTLIPGMPPLSRRPVFGLGHSLGAGILTVHQATTGPFDGLVLLGRALVSGGMVPARASSAAGAPEWRPMGEQHDAVLRSSELVDGYPHQRARTAWQHYLFHWDDVPTAVIEHDDSLASSIPLDVARELAAPGGPERSAAATVDVPVLLAYGERDVTRDPPSEASAFLSSPDVRVDVIPRSGHCTNLSSQRAVLWDRILAWFGERTGPPTG